MSYLAIFSIFAFTQASQWSGINISLAVMEYHPKSEGLSTNAAEYNKSIKSIKPLDIIVFPENTLTLSTTDAVELTVSENPCHEESSASFLRDISCAVKDSNTYAIINLIQKVKCTSKDENPICQSCGFYLYNTNVVFDRTGTIIHLYHKYNFLAKAPFTKPSAPEEIIIETDLGLNLGIFTGSEIMMKSPAEKLVAKKVDAVIYPAQWYSELPFLTALQIQQMWSHAHNIKFFAAGANNPQVGSGGSGIFSGAEDPCIFYINSASGSTSISCGIRQSGKVRSGHEEEVDRGGRNMDRFHLNIDPNVTEYTSKVLDTTKEDINGQVCHDGDPLCCNFTIRITTNESVSGKNTYTYHMVAFSGVRPFVDFGNIGVEFCAIIACLNSSVSSCGQRFATYEDIEWSITFENITIVANFDVNENKTQYPNSLLSSIEPVPVSQSLWEKEEIEVDGKNVVQTTFSLTKPQGRLLTFAIYGRDFGRDSAAVDDGKCSLGSSARTNWIHLINTFIVFFIVALTSRNFTF